MADTNMNSVSKISWTEFRPQQRTLATGAVLTGLGALTATVGIGVLVYELARAGRNWTGTWDVPPAELAARTLHQAQNAAQSAAQAGRDSWRSQG
ncbi:hypothetical protein [Streptomyces beijiangensis]|uniref:Uncharacterized protein n=1 Tax=Streptomyces beijiangensis TaxID=163361 RepID=A0A939F4B9_9ACTN|nr:hypothetical protein [Streptomyces beijiangensis]MBO0511663.1 hypothetical protein [Streptomyces beijiangensis]